MDKLLEFAVKYWRKRTGLFVSAVLCIAVYFTSVKLFVDDIKIQETYVFHAPFLVAILLILFIAWVSTSRRKHIASGEKVFKIGLSFLSDEAINDPKIWSIINPILKDIDRSKNLDFLKIIPLDENRFRNREDVGKYIASNLFDIKNVLWLQVESGQIDSNDKVLIKRGTFVCERPYDGVIFHGTRIDIRKEVLIRTVNKSWGYLEKESLIEKRRLKENLKDIILYYAGINLLCLGQFEESLKTLKVLYHSDGQPKIVEAKETQDVSLQNALAERLGEILAKLYTQVSHDYHNSNQNEKAFKFLLEAEAVIQDNGANYWNFVQLARLYYEAGDLNKATLYTDKMEASKGFTNEVALNRGFFSVIKGDSAELIKNYKRLRPNKSRINGVDVLAFLNRESSKFPQHAALFKYAMGFIKMNYVTYSEGRKELGKLISEIRTNPDYSKITAHCQLIMAKR